MRRTWAVIAAALATLGGTLALWLVLGGTPPSSGPAERDDLPDREDGPRPVAGGCCFDASLLGERLRRLPAGGHVTLVAVGAGSVWTVAARGSGTGRAIRLAVVRLNPRTGARRRYRYRGSSEARIRVGHGAVWLADPQTRAITRIDLGGRGRRVIRPFRGGAPRELAVGPAGVWAIDDARPRLAQLDPRSGRLRRIVHIREPVELGDVAVDRRHIWLTDAANGRVLRLHARTAASAGPATAVGGRPLDIESEGRRTWADLSDGDGVVAIDADVRTPVRIADDGGEAFAIAIGFGALWVSNHGKGTVSRLDLRTGQPLGEPIRVGGAPAGIAIGEGRVWVATEGCAIVGIRP